jgi:hypothetical protein
MKKILLLLVIIISGNYLFAQSNPKLKELLNDPNITWIGEYETYFPFEIVNDFIGSMSARDFLRDNYGGLSYRTVDVYSKENQEKIGVDLLKITKVKQMRSIYSEDEDDINPPKYQCNALLLEWVKSRKLKAYYDADLTKGINSEFIESIGISSDTLYVINPETFEPEANWVTNELRLEQIQLTRAKYYIYFNNKNKTWNIYTLSVAVVAEKYDSNGDSKGYENLFWIPVDNDTIVYDYTEAIYPEVRRSVVQVSFDKARVLKQGKSLKESNEILIDEIRKGNEIKHISYYEHGNVKLTKMEMESIGESIDTILYNDSETGEIMKSVVISPKLEPKNINGVRLVQDWYWDEKLNKLKVNFVSYAPIYDRVVNGILMMRTPLFYEKMMKTKFDKQKSKKK